MLSTQLVRQVVWIEYIVVVIGRVPLQELLRVQERIPTSGVTE